LCAIKNPCFGRSEIIPFIFLIVFEILVFRFTGAKLTHFSYLFFLSFFIFFLFIASADCAINLELFWMSPPAAVQHYVIQVKQPVK